MRNIFAILLLLGVTGCDKRPADATAAKEARSSPKRDACSLITKEEVGTIQESEVRDIKSSARPSKGFYVTQCYYATAESTRSVSLELTTSDFESPDKRSPKEFWEMKISREKPPEEAEGRAAKQVPPKKIEGIGDAAYGSITAMGATLYVLKQDAFIRISIGGLESEEIKLGRVKALAEKALSRL